MENFCLLHFRFFKDIKSHVSNYAQIFQHIFSARSQYKHYQISAAIQFILHVYTLLQAWVCFVFCISENKVFQCMQIFQSILLWLQVQMDVFGIWTIPSGPFYLSIRSIVHSQLSLRMLATSSALSVRLSGTQTREIYFRLCCMLLSVINY